MRAAEEIRAQIARLQRRAADARQRAAYAGAVASKGVLAAERRIPVDEAFEVLRRHARSHSVSLHSVAEAVVSLRLRP
jgi:AmiR/NasT family two-component response regulator